LLQYLQWVVTDQWELALEEAAEVEVMMEIVKEV
jgi:hypothetical protein